MYRESKDSEKMSVSLDEFLEMMRKEHPEDIDWIELAITGIFWRESVHVIAHYTHLPVSFIRKLRQQLKEENNRDYFTI